ncbi:MAG: hypothetical protein O7F16_08275 [Acidobacteria bacterium]|nr:hypothetical protein [Acidobacteriota bacterium]
MNERPVIKEVSTHRCSSLFSHLTVGLILVGASFTIAPAVTIEIDPGSYTGRYSVAGHAITTGPTTVKLEPGTYTFKNASSTDGGSFLFKVKGNGKVRSLNRVAGEGVGSTLVLKNTNIVVHPKNYTSGYRLESSYPGPFTGIQSFVVIPGLSYRWHNHTVPSEEIRNPDFVFEVDALGQVTSQNTVAGRGVGNTLVLSNTSIIIDAGNYTGSYRRCQEFPNHSFLTDAQTLVLVPGLSYCLTNGAGGSFLFEVDAFGQVASLNMAAAQSIGNTLRLQCASVRVDPTTFTGSYSAHGFLDAFVGPTDITFIPGVLTTLFAGGQFASFTPDVSQVAPRSLTLAIAGHEHTFLLSTLGPCAVTGNSDIKPERIANRISPESGD